MVLVEGGNPNHLNLLRTRNIFFLFQRIIMPPKDADGMANTVDPDQTVPKGQSNLVGAV